MANPNGNIKHGGTGTLTYKRWASMMARCHHTSDGNYKHYGAKGITVCDSWHDFAAFRNDMGECPDNEFTLDRKENAEGYGPKNCRWATKIEQNRNRTNNRILFHDGESLCVSEWAERTGLSSHAILARMKRGWSVDRTLTTLRDARAGRTIPSKTYRRAA